MRKIAPQDIITLAKNLIFEANFYLPQKVQARLKKLNTEESSPASKSAIRNIIKNFEIAPKEKLPLCQDTGTAVFFVEIGHEIELEEPLEKTLKTATKQAYEQFFLRKSIAQDPLYDRKNTTDNCPPIVHYHQTEGEKLKMWFLPKGGGAENKSILKMLRPADGEKGVFDTVLEAAKNAGGSSCPPWIVGIGIGGSFDSVASLAKKAIIRPLGEKNKNPKYADLERRITKEIENLHIGALGFGGQKTLLGVHIETAPTHIASLPVAVNFQCHSARSAYEEI